MENVNLDALIPREDFEVTETSNKGTKKATISVEDLRSESFFYYQLTNQIFNERLLIGI